MYNRHGYQTLLCVYRHPVRHIEFNGSTLVTANIPDEKQPRGACITDDDLTAHRRWLQMPATLSLLMFDRLFMLYLCCFCRHRGLICHYDFSMDSLAPDHVLPICRSNYIESSGYNFNIGLAMPYDILSGL